MHIRKREKEVNLYKAFQNQTLRRIEQLCSNTWTDYNDHDPGITIADIFNYALFELNYRLSFSKETYLLAKGQNTVHFDRKGLFPKEELFASSCVTEFDYETLLKSKFPQFSKCRVIFQREEGTYQILFSLKGDSQIEEKSMSLLKEDIRKVYHQHRNLGEKLSGVFLFSEAKKHNKVYHERFIKATPKYKVPVFLSQIDSAEKVQFFQTDYHSMQLDFPECYGISNQGALTHTTKEGKVHIMQLKGYLLLMDTLMADVLRQAGHTKTILDLSGKIPHTKTPRIAIPGSEELIEEAKREQFTLHKDSFYNQQKSNYLDLLDALYGEETNVEHLQEDKVAPTLDENEKRANLIHQLLQHSGNRFQGLNIYDKLSEPTIQFTLNQLTDGRYESDKSNSLSKYGLRLISDDIFFEKYKFLNNIAFALNLNDGEELLEIPKTVVEYSHRTFHELRKSINLLWYNVLFDSFLKYADASDYYRIRKISDKEFLLVFRHPEKNIWINLGIFFDSLGSVIRIANLFWEFMQRIKHKEGHCNFYFIEQTLLDEKVVNFNEISVVTSAVGKTREDKRQIKKLLAERLPIHLLVEVYFVPAEQINKLKHLYQNWREALENTEAPKIKHNASCIRSFLAHNKQNIFEG